MDFFSITNDQLIYGGIVLVGVLILGYFLKMMLKIFLVGIALIGVIYVLTTNPDDIDLKHVTTWVKDQAEFSGDKATMLSKEANERLSNMGFDDAQDLLEQGRLLIKSVIHEKEDNQI